jgi:hypothetical protein
MGLAMRAIDESSDLRLTARGRPAAKGRPAETTEG